MREPIGPRTPRSAMAARTAPSTMPCPQCITQFSQSRSVSGLALLVGYFWMLWDRDRQTWHDKFVGAVVVRERLYPVVR